MRNLLLLVALTLVGCTAIYVGSGGDRPLNIQTTDSTNVLGSQSVVSQDKAAKGDATSNGSNSQTTESTPTTTLTPFVP
jgi:hypothetical protein